jgi:ribonuclease Z
MVPALGELGAREIAPGEVWNDEGLVITAFLVDHAPITPAYGYRFDYKGRSVVVSGDSNVVESLVSAAKDADLLLHDALSLPIVKAMEDGAKQAGRTRQAKILGDIQNYHAGANTMWSLKEESGVGMLAIYHLVPPPRNILMERIFKRDLPAGTVLTRDGMVFSLLAGTDDIRITEP